jgi:hypothetical protein
MSTCKGKGLVAKFDTNTRDAPAVRNEKLDTKLCPKGGILHIVIAPIAYRSSLRDYLKSVAGRVSGYTFRKRRHIRTKYPHAFNCSKEISIPRIPWIPVCEVMSTRSAIKLFLGGTETPAKYR